MKQRIALILFVFTTTVYSQEFQVPNNIQLETKADYKKYEASVLEAINWLENTSALGQKDKREEVSAFVLKWIIGTPSVSIGLQTFQTNLTKKNSALLISFMGGWVKYALENPSGKDDILAANVAGIQSLIKVYSFNKGNGIKKDKKIEKLIKMNSLELEGWIKEQI